MFSNSKSDDDISVYDDDFENIEYVEVSLSDPEIVKTRSGKITHADYSFPEYDSFCFEIEPDQAKLINLVKNDISYNSSNDLLLEEVDLFLSNNSIPPGIENVADDPEGDIREEIPVVLNDKDEDVYSSFIFVIFAKMFSLLFAESEDTIFDPGISE
nr:hypothetical protein [Tanacetum cinerariifolium]